VHDDDVSFGQSNIFTIITPFRALTSIRFSITSAPLYFLRMQLHTHNSLPIPKKFYNNLHKSTKELGNVKYICHCNL